MADTKISALTALDSFVTGDLLPMVDDPAGTPVTKKATIDQVKTFVSSSPTLVTPALGTPSSGTLTNCTGLPVAGITASTSTALGVGSIELGHASDTTLARSAAGVVSVEGVNLVSTWQPAFVAANHYVLNGPGELGTGVAIGNATIAYAPFVLPRGITVSQLGARVRTTSAGGFFKVAIYANGLTGGQNRPNGTPLAETGDMATDTAANVIADITGADVTLSAWTVYWAAFRIDNATAALQTAQCISGGGAPLLVGTSTLANVMAANNYITALTSAETYVNAWPNATSETFTEISASGLTYNVALIGLAA